MDLNTEFGQLEQALLQVVRGAVEVDREVGQHVEHVEVGLVEWARFHVVLGVQRGDLVQDESAFCFHLVVVLSETSREGIVLVSALGLAQHVVLAPGQVGDAALQPGSAFGAVLAGLLLGPVHVAGEQVSPVRVE